MSKQTATQYLIEEIKNDSLVQAKSTEEWNEVFRISKEMEREQIVTSFNIGEFEGFIKSNKRNGTDYYIETYGGNNE